MLLNSYLHHFRLNIPHSKPEKLLLYYKQSTQGNLTKCHIPFPSSSSLLLESQPHHGPTSPSCVQSFSISFFSIPAYLRSSPLIPLFFKYLMTVFPVFCAGIESLNKTPNYPNVPTFQFESAPFLWLALVLSLALITITPLSVAPSWKVIFTYVGEIIL